MGRKKWFSSAKNANTINSVQKEAGALLAEITRKGNRRKKRMIKIENIDVYGFESAIRGMRNPKNSWDKSDSKFHCDDFNNCNRSCKYYDVGCSPVGSIYIGENDLDLMKRLFKGGTEHRKYLRMINVTMDITAPLYWWKEFDTYKVGTVANSCSTMHKIHDKEFTLDDFSHEHLKDCESVACDEFLDFPCGRAYTPMDSLIDTIKMLNKWREVYLNCGKNKSQWWQMIQLLPSSYNQRRTVQMNYEVAVNIIRQRKSHKLDEWHIMVDELLNLPYMKEIMGVEHEIN